MQYILLLLCLRPLEDVPGLSQDQVQLDLEFFKLQYYFLTRRLWLGVEIYVRLLLYQIEKLTGNLI